MARFSDAQAGWTIYRDFDYSLSLDELNRRLMNAGFSPISIRTFQHYQKLRRYGYESYLPINQLDVKTLQNPVWDAAMKNRYGIIEVRIPIQVRVLVDPEPGVFEAEALQLSEGVVAARIRGSEALEFFESRASWKNRNVEVVFRETGEIKLTTLDTVGLDISQGAVNLRMGFTEMLAIERVARREPLAPSTIRITVETREPDELALSVVVEDLWWLLQALETARVVCQDILLALDEDRRFLLPTTRLKLLKVESPLEAIIDAGIPHILLLYFSVKGLLGLQGKYWTNQLLKEQALKARSDNRQQGIRPRLDVERVVDAMSRVVHDLLSGEGTGIGKRGLDPERLKSLIEKQLEPSVEGLGKDETSVSIELDQRALELAEQIEDEMEDVDNQDDPQ